MKFQDDIVVRDSVRARLDGRGGSGGERVVRPGTPPQEDGLVPRVNVKLSLIDPRSGRVVEKRESHNIFVDYGRDWLAHLMGLDTGDTPFRTDLLKYMAFGIGGASQIVSSDDIRNTSIYNYPGFPDDWAGGSGAGDPSQVHTDPSITALEWPVEVVSGEYYDVISQPATFPDTGIIRLTAVLGLNEVSFGTTTSVPISEVGLFTSQVETQTGGLATPPLVWGGQPTVDKAMVAYNQFSSLSKTNDFVLQVDWEIRVR